MEQTSLYIWKSVKAAMYDAASDTQKQAGKRITPNDWIIYILWRDHPDIAEKHGLPKPDYMNEAETDSAVAPHPKQTPEFILEPAV